MDRFAHVGKGLENVVKGYNEAVGTSRQLNATRRKFAELGTGDPDSIDTCAEISAGVRIVETDHADVRESILNDGGGTIKLTSSTRVTSTTSRP
jgi:hypothetical protein